MTLAVKVALNPNTTNQLKLYTDFFLVQYGHINLGTYAIFLFVLTLVLND